MALVYYLWWLFATTTVLERFTIRTEQKWFRQRSWIYLPEFFSDFTKFTPSTLRVFTSDDFKFSQSSTPRKTSSSEPRIQFYWGHGLNNSLISIDHECVLAIIRWRGELPTLKHFNFTLSKWKPSQIKSRGPWEKHKYPAFHKNHSYLKPTPNSPPKLPANYAAWTGCSAQPTGFSRTSPAHASPSSSPRKSTPS